MTTAAHLAPPSHRRGLAVIMLAALIALALVFFMVSSVTSAAWTDTTENAGNSWATGTVSLTDDDGGVAMFSATGMVPGQTVTNDIVVTNGSTVPLDVRLHGANLVNTDLLAQYVNVSIGTTSGASDVYSGTLAAFATAHTEYSNGTPVIAMAAAGTQTYYFSVTLDSATPDAFQNKTAGIEFVWTGQTQ